MSVKKEMSFLPEDDDINSLSARAIHWLTTVGRYVIVFSELIVICAFISRFWLDRINSDLSESVRQQEAILQTTVDFESQYALLQQRLKVIGNYYQNQPQYKSYLASLVESTPAEITYNKLILKQDPTTSEISANLSLFSFQETSIINFISNLILNPKVASVNVEKIERKPKEAKYLVDLSLVFHKGK